MSKTTKVFWGLVAWGILSVIVSLSMPSTASVEEPVKTYGKEEQCKTSKWYVVYWTYNGKPVAKNTHQCFNDLMIRSENM